METHEEAMMMMDTEAETVPSLDPTDDDYKPAPEDEEKAARREARQNARNLLPAWGMAPPMAAFLPFFITYVVFSIRSLAWDYKSCIVMPNAE